MDVASWPGKLRANSVYVLPELKREWELQAQDAYVKLPLALTIREEVRMAQ